MKDAPPVINAHLYKRIAELKAEASARDAKSTQSRQQTNQPLYIYNQLKNWISTLTPDQLNRQYEIQEIISLAKVIGKHRQAPSFQQAAAALRLLGFENRRSWVKSSRNHRYWQFIGE